MHGMWFRVCWSKENNNNNNKQSEKERERERGEDDWFCSFFDLFVADNVKHASLSLLCVCSFFGKKKKKRKKRERKSKYETGIHTLDELM